MTVKHNAQMLLAAAFACGLGCSSDGPVELAVRVFVPASCALGNDGYVFARGYGDYEASPTPLGFFVRDGNVTLDGIRSTAREVVLTASLGEKSWSGRADFQRGADVLLSQENNVCTLADAVDSRTEGMLVAYGNDRALLVAGKNQNVPRSFSFDGHTGKSTPLGRDLLRQRVSASATATGDASNGGRVVIAGGLRADSGEPLSDAEVFRDGAFDRNAIALSGARSAHAAVDLHGNHVLLLGGLGTNGVLGSLELVDTDSNVSETAGLTSLEVPRRDLAAVGLANGEVLVFGGRDAQGNDVSAIEWIARDARSHVRTGLQLKFGAGSKVLALPNGGVFAATLEGTRASLWTIGEGGAIGAAGGLEGVTSLALFADVDGAVSIFTGRAWLRFGTWDRSLSLLASLGNEGPKSELFVGMEPGLALFADDAAEGTHLRVLRTTSVSTYGPLDEALAFTDTRSLVPVSSGLGPPAFSTETGITLLEGERIAIVDRFYRDFEVSFERRGAPAEIVLRTEGGDDFAVGGAACPYRSEQKSAVVRIARIDNRIEGDATCDLPFATGERVAIHPRGPAGSAQLRSLVVSRK